MYKEENINILYKLLCLILFIIIIFYVNSIISLLCLFTFLYFINKDVNNYFWLSLLLLSISFLIVGYVSGNILLAKIILLIDVSYHFMRNIKIGKSKLGTNKLLEPQYTYRKLSINYKSKLEKEISYLIDEQINDNNNLTNENIENINNNISKKIDNEIYEKLITNYLRFYKNQNDKNRTIKLDYFNIVYLIIHIIVIVLMVVVE